jgi:hypothetical protein
MKIHPNKESAQKAIAEYLRRVSELSETLGVWEENEDSCCNIYAKAKYQDENGMIIEYSDW